MFHKTKQKYYHNQIIISKNDIASTWKIVNEAIPSHKSKPSINVTENAQRKAESFNTFFACVGKETFEKTQRSEIDNQGLCDSESECESSLFRPQTVDTNTVILTLKNINKSKSFGSDNISLRFINDSLFVIACYLTDIINTSISTGQFSTAWKHATVTPLFKSGEKDNPSNYRQISILPVLSKILEKNSFIEAYNIPSFK